MSKKLFSNVKKRFVSGLLIMLPLFITIVILRFLFRITAGIFAPILLYFFPTLPVWLKFLSSFGVLVAVIYLLGLVTGHFLGRWFWNRFEQALLRIPLLKSIYGASRDMVHVFSNQSRAGFKEVVLVEFPRAGMKAVGFITGSITDDSGRLCYKVFIPTTPNPTTGFLEIIEQSEVVRCNLTVEEGIRMIMSGGILGPEVLCRGNKNQSV